MMIDHMHNIHSVCLHISIICLCRRSTRVCAAWNQWSIYVTGVGQWNVE